MSNVEFKMQGTQHSPKKFFVAENYATQSECQQTQEYDCGKYIPTKYE